MILAFGIIIVIRGLLSIFLKLENIPGLGGQSPVYYENEQNAIIIGIIELVIGFSIILWSVKRKQKNKYIEFSKCPKCKETFRYKELSDGKCPKCNVNTIDINKYYPDGDKKYIWEDLD